MTCLLLVGCTSTAVKDNILMPLAAKVFDNVLPHIELGLKDAVADGDLDQATADYLLAEAKKLSEYLNQGLRDEASTIDWQSLEPWASRGVQALVDDGTISPGVATSLFQRIVNFRDLLIELNSLISWSSTRSRYSETEVVGGKPVFLGYEPELDLTWNELDRHNRPRRELGLPEITATEAGL
jgi:hypothetical protein